MQVKPKTYIISILIPLSVGGLAAFLIRDNLFIYRFINKPAWAPPAFLFPVVWTVLYILMGISSARIYSQKAEYSYEVMDALFTYTLQLIINFFWPIIFFNMRTFLFAFLWIVLLWICILKMIFKFSVLDKTAAVIQIPYFLWITYAGYLNLMIYLLQ